MVTHTNNNNRKYPIVYLSNVNHLDRLTTLVLRASSMEKLEPERILLKGSRM